MTQQQKKDAIAYIESQLEYGYIDLGGHEVDELEIVREAVAALKRSEGKWLPQYEMFSNAQETVPIATNFDCSICGTNVANAYKYCPNCGAKMMMKKEIEHTESEEAEK